MQKYFRFTFMVMAVITAAALTGCSLLNTEKDKVPENAPAAVKTEEKKSGDKVYVALEEDGAVAVVDVQSRKLTKKISLETDEGQEFMAHNVQVAPDGTSVWATANAMKKSMHGSIIAPPVSAETMSEESSEVIVIDPITDTIVKRILLGEKLELAHVVLSPDSKTALVTSQTEGLVFVIDAEKKELIRKIELGGTSEPHGARITPDGSTAYVALIKGKGIAQISMADYLVTNIALNGEAVQTAITPDGAKVIATLFDTKKLAVYDIAGKTVQEIDLPDGSKGPLQLYPTSDSNFVYVADQGYYNKQPNGEKVYKIELKTGQVIAEITAGTAPHGVVISNDGAYVYVSNLLSNDVSVIDTASNTEVAKIRVGKGPNGISYWSLNR